jgi:hypothetical protein
MFKLERICSSHFALSYGPQPKRRISFSDHRTTILNFFDSWFSAQERITYRHFALYIHRPKLAFFFSTTLHWLRIVAFAFIGIALWQALYIESALLALFTLFLSGTIASMYPDLYFEDAAKRGNRGATEMLHRLRHIQELIKS